MIIDQDSKIMKSSRLPDKTYLQKIIDFHLHNRHDRGPLYLNIDPYFQYVKFQNKYHLKEKQT
jgi:hypothetical protein